VDVAKAVGFGIVKVFARAETIGKADASGFPPTLQERIRQSFTTGAVVKVSYSSLLVSRMNPSRPSSPLVSVTGRDGGGRC
jgi:hypothetical protein